MKDDHSVSPGFSWAKSGKGKETWLQIRQDVNCENCRQKMCVDNINCILKCPNCGKAFAVKEV